MKPLKHIPILLSVIFLVSAVLLPIARAQTDNPVTDIRDSRFKLVVCDGPNIPGGNPEGYVVCDFNGLMKTVQHLINVMIIAGVLAAIVGFCYAGFTYITGGPNKKSEATDVFKKVGLGFVIMLSAWFIVYQIIDWLTGSGAFSKLLGNP